MDSIPSQHRRGRGGLWTPVPAELHPRVSGVGAQGPRDGEHAGRRPPRPDPRDAPQARRTAAWNPAIRLFTVRSWVLYGSLDNFTASCETCLADRCGFHPSFNTGAACSQPHVCRNTRYTHDARRGVELTELTGVLIVLDTSRERDLRGGHPGRRPRHEHEERGATGPEIHRSTRVVPVSVRSLSIHPLPFNTHSILIVHPSDAIMFGACAHRQNERRRTLRSGSTDPTTRSLLKRRAAAFSPGHTLRECTTGEERKRPDMAGEHRKDARVHVRSGRRDGGSDPLVPHPRRDEIPAALLVREWRRHRGSSSAAATIVRPRPIRSDHARQ